MCNTTVLWLGDLNFFLDVFSNTMNPTLKTSDEALEAFFRKITIEKCLQRYERYVFKCRVDQREVVLKFVTDQESCDGRDYDILEDIQKRTAHPELFPKPVDRVFSQIPCTVAYGDIFINNCLGAITFDFIPGEILCNVETLVNYEAARANLFMMLEELHSLGYCHGDIHAGNIVVRDDGLPVLIDYGSSFCARYMKCKTAWEPLASVRGHYLKNSDYFSLEREELTRDLLCFAP